MAAHVKALEKGEKIARKMAYRDNRDNHCVWRMDKMAENVHILTDDNFTETVKEGVALVDFYASWCGPCRMLAPIIEELATHFEGKAKIGKVDIDSEQKTAMEFQVTSVPTIVLFKEGKEINRVVGLRDVEALKELVQEAL